MAAITQTLAYLLYYLLYDSYEGVYPWVFGGNKSDVTKSKFIY
jgi:hypothetical protein